MNQRPLGQSDIGTSVVGLGTWVMGGWMWGGANEADSINAIHASIDEGVNLIDTAPIYGFGLSEEIVGKATCDRRDKVVLATKCGMVCNTTRGDFKFRSDAHGPADHGHISIYINQRSASIREEVEQSLKRLQTDCIDLYQTHWQDSTTPIEDTMGVLLDLKSEGKIRAIGVSNATPLQMDTYRAIGPIDADQEKYSMLDRELDDDQLPYCNDHNIAVLAYSPLSRGLLTGKVTPEYTFAEGDQRRESPRFTVAFRKQVQALFANLNDLLDAHACTPAQLAIAWAIHQPGLTHALVGARSVHQARENAAAGRIKLTDNEQRAINDAIDNLLGTPA